MRREQYSSCAIEQSNTLKAGYASILNLPTYTFGKRGMLPRNSDTFRHHASSARYKENYINADRHMLKSFRRQNKGKILPLLNMLRATSDIKHFIQQLTKIQ